MRPRLPSMILAALCTLGCHAAAVSAPASAPVAASVPTPEPPTIVFLVRHAEKATDDPRDPALTQPGAARASCLNRTLAQAGVTHVFSSEFKRTQATVAPLAESLGLQIRTIPANDGREQVQALRDLPAGSIAIVAGHSNTVPALAQRLGGTLHNITADGQLDHAEYDRFVQLVLSGSGTQTIEMRYCAPSS